MASNALDTIRAIEDPAARAKAAGKKVRALRAQIVKYRTLRNHAAVALVRDHKWPKTRVVAHLGITRTAFKRIYEQAPEALPEFTRHPKAVATQAHTALMRAEAQNEQFRQIRDDAILFLLFERKLPNHEVAKATGEHQVRVAQLRADALA